VTKPYQEYRLLADKAKIARAIFISVRNEPELNLLFDANQCFELALQRKKIEDARWKESDGQIRKRNPIYRFTIGTWRIVELSMIEASGFLTDWGRSPIKSMWLLISAVLVFSLVYRFALGDDFIAAMFRALNCAFVFGYTKYSMGAKAQAIDYTMFVNTLFGLYWYALFIPALSKRLFR